MTTPDATPEKIEIRPHVGGRPKIDLDDEALQIIAQCSFEGMPDDRTVAMLNAAGYNISGRTFRRRKNEGTEDEPSPVLSAMEQGKSYLARTRGRGFIRGLERGDPQLIKHHDAIYYGLNPSQRVDLNVSEMSEDEVVAKVQQLLEVAEERAKTEQP